MRVDRSLVGVIGIAIVLSTLITLFIIGERAKEDVTILRNEFPTKLSAMEQKYAFVPVSYTHLTLPTIYSV